MSTRDTAGRSSSTGLAVVLLLLSGLTWGGSAPTDAQLFLNEAAQGSVAEISLGQLAEQRAENKAVAAYGTRMVNDHSQALTKVRHLASARGMQLVEQLADEHNRMAKELSAQQGREFDRAYIGAMVDDHRRTVEKFETQGAEGSGEVAAFAREQLPVLKQHLAEAEALAKRL